MNRKNKHFFILLLTGILAMFIGTIIKINGNPNAVYILGTSLVIELVAILSLIIYNWSKIRDNLLK